jgi:N-acyl-D-amino-acid deacylase
MTKKVAERFNIQKRGEIKEGYFADLVLFNADTVNSRSTIAKPQVYPDGITAVLVNGEIVVQNGAHKGKRPGQVIRRTA